MEGTAADDRDRLKGCVAEVLSQELGVATPRSFQLNAIHSIACEHKRALVVQPTGSGKSIQVICSAILLMGVILVVVPLLSVGADQFSSAFEAYSAPNFRVFQVTESMHAGDKEAIISFLMDLKTRADGTTIIYIAAESLRLDGAWSPVIDQLFARGLVSLCGRGSPASYGPLLSPRVYCAERDAFRQNQVVVTQGCAFGDDGDNDPPPS